MVDRSEDDESEELASPGHKLGQLIGDWFEEYVVLPLLRDVASRLGFYLDHRFQSRAVRGDKLQWHDDEGNSVAFDFVLELGGTDGAVGKPVAFFEGCWRRGTRHSKDKARDDTGKLLPMRSTYPTARFLGMLVAGDFTGPARDLVLSRLVNLFYIPKAKVVDAFASAGITIDYPDNASKERKAELANAFVTAATPELKRQVADKLRDLVGRTDVDNYVTRVHGALGALPQEIRIAQRRTSQPKVFESVEAVRAFLASPSFDFNDSKEDFVYSATFSDGAEFEMTVSTLEALRALHAHTEELVAHMSRISV